MWQRKRITASGGLEGIRIWVWRGAGIEGGYGKGNVNLTRQISPSEASDTVLRGICSALVHSENWRYSDLVSLLLEKIRLF